VILFAGEVMPKPWLADVARAFPQARLANLYGPTETNVCTWHDVTEADLADPGPLPIGRAIDATRLWIVDPLEHDRPTDEGELLVAGPTVTTGYWGDAAMTATRLVSAPDGHGAAYRTGDRVRRRPDGVLDFLGRVDRMLKVAGYRIEPGEIEHALQTHPAVREAAVLGATDDHGATQVAAYIALEPGATVDAGQLSEHCRKSLPPYMTPAAWRFLPELPRGDRGKVDYRALRVA
jgi:acyl-coenzyme A synthetase/AMP-(fatty) acid ligase